MEATSNQKIKNQLGKPRRFRSWIGGIATISLMLLALWFVLSRAKDERVTWLSPKGFNQTVKSGAFTKLTRRLLSPVQRWVMDYRNQPNVNMRNQLLALSSPLQKDILGPALSTNRDGLRAWILQEKELEQLRSRLEKIDGVDEISAPQILTASGTIAQVQGANFVWYAGKQPLGLIVELKPKITGDSILLLLNASYAVSTTSTNNAASAPKLEFEAMCRAMIPDGGTIVIAGHNPGSTNKTDYLLMVTSTQVDAIGRRVPHPKR